MVSPTFDHRDTGTSEGRWTPLAIGSLPQLALDKVTHLLVVAAHPDDETLGAGGLISTFAASGRPVTILMATDGELSHPDSTTHDPSALAAIRRRETVAAVAHLAPQARIVRAEIPDGEVTGHREQLTRVLDPLVRPGTLLIAPWHLDRHPDHEAAAVVTAQVAAHHDVDVRHYPIWGWHWGSPDDAEFDRSTMSRVPLPPAARIAKAMALARYRSQVLPLSAHPGDEPVLTPSVLAHFERSDEVFFAPPRRDDSEPHAPGSLDQAWFDDFYRGGSDPWGFTDRWYEERKRAVLLASLPRRRFRSAYEPGCSIGVLTAELARRCDRLLATDISPAPLTEARERVKAFGHVRIEQRNLTSDWPDESFDLVILSEVGYYLSEPDLRTTARSLRAGLTEDAVVVLCHWRHPVEDYPLSGDRTHEIVREELALRVRVSHVEPDFRLEILAGPGVPDVAEAEGLR